jgi:predicted O-methyltransferase YrrM
VDILQAPTSDQEWVRAAAEIDALGISHSGGSNAGDCRAVFYLVCYLRPKAILEIGTRLGATLARMAVAMRTLAMAEDFTPVIHTVDIADVNSNATWGPHCRYSPRDSLRKLGCGPFVKFFNQRSLDYFAQSNQRFDLIFLDGSHEAIDVYQELALALKALNPNGSILLHDYYPHGWPLFDDADPIPGPFLAVRRHQREGTCFQALPLGYLPWWTRSNSSATSLALLGRTEQETVSQN